MTNTTKEALLQNSYINFIVLAHHRFFFLRIEQNHKLFQNCTAYPNDRSKKKIFPPAGIYILLILTRTDLEYRSTLMASTKDDSSSPREFSWELGSKGTWEHDPVSGTAGITTS